MKTVEETYQKKTPKEHILLRPDTYIGSVDKDTTQMYVWSEEQQRIISRTITFAPGLYKIFDEIIVNAADNKIRDPRMTTLMVDINQEKNEICVYNDGKGIPVVMHAKENVYVPELIFGHLLTSSNYDDNEKKVTGGRNGYGAKLCNIFSVSFTVETCDGKHRYVQRFTDNMSVTHPPEIERSKKEYTKIIFKPDLRRFKMDRLDDDIVSLLTRRVYDMCGTLGKVGVHLNGRKLEIHGFKEYVKLYLNDSETVVHQRINDRWELAFSIAEEQFTQVSFVNSIATTKGGTHISHVLDQIVEPIIEAVKKKEKGLVVKPIHVRSSIFLFVNALVENPSFDSQTKENLTLRAQGFGSKCQPIDNFIKEIIKKTTLVDRVLSLSKAKQSAQLKKTDGTKASRLSGIPKLEDANLAGSRRSSECTLILTEGDSAKTLAVAGLSVVGRDTYGVFPLRGKLLNVREANMKQILENAEISNIKKILGLQHGKTYEDVSALRYGHVMIMTDQDHDGSHIKGLIINFLDHFYPSLLKVTGFLQEFITPIIRATSRSTVLDFFTIPEYETFKSFIETKNPDLDLAGKYARYINTSPSSWHIKYYKGLGTSTSKDAKQYFSNLPIHVKNFQECDDSDKTLIDLAFNKKKADMRKSWLGGFVEGTYLDQSFSIIKLSDFINRELILFSMADNIRSIPSVLDGLKPGQRKVLFSCFKRKLSGEIKVAQLVGYVSEQSAYHHGEQSLSSTIVNLAHDFVGSNNINLLLPIGSFGSRLQGGKDAASPRYIYTGLNPITRMIFHEHDDPLLEYLTEDNQSIEPKHYVPIIPMVLVNGADGIGTGWSTNIPNYNPLDIIDNLRRMMDGEELHPMVPYYRNFRGSISENTEGRYAVSGSHILNEGCINITELPVGTWTQTYKEYLEALLQSGTVKDYKEYHTEKTVDFLINPIKEFPLKLTTMLSTNNMICFDENGMIKKYNSPQEIIRAFYHVRLRAYVDRKSHLLDTIKKDLIKLENKARFIRMVVEDRLVISRRPNAEIIMDLEANRFERLNEYEYLLGMRISSLSKENMERLNGELVEKRSEYETLFVKQPIDIWREDLGKLENEYNTVLLQEKKEYDQELKKKVKKNVFGKAAMLKIREEPLKDKGDAKSTATGTKGAKRGKEDAKKGKGETGSTKDDKSKKKAVKEKKVKKAKLSKEDSIIVASDSSSEGIKPWDKYRD